MCEEKEGVMRNAMTTRAPGGANKRIKTCVAGIIQFFDLCTRLVGHLEPHGHLPYFIQQ